MIIRRIKEPCCICGRPLNGSYRYDRFGNKCCTTHLVTLCHNCGRIVTNGESTLCDDCNRHVVRNTSRLRQRICQDIVINDLKSLGIFLPLDSINITIVNMEQMDKLLGRSSKNILGLTISRSCLQQFTHNIYILEGLMPHQYKSTLSHEFGHVWLNHRNSKLNQMEDKYIEGFCNLLAYKVLLRDVSDDSKQARAFMLKNPDPIYGEGFRIMKARADRIGWDHLLKEAS